MIKIYVRRYKAEPWSEWAAIDSLEKARMQADLIESAGWEWSCAELGQDLRELAIPRVEEKRGKSQKQRRRRKRKS